VKAYGGVDVKIHIFLTTALAGGEWSASRPRRFTPGERSPGTRWIRGWVDPRVGLDEVEKRKFLTLQGLELRPLGRPARRQSLYRLRYPGSSLFWGTLVCMVMNLGVPENTGDFLPSWTSAVFSCET
jgi:hypothetical protein